MSAGPKIRLALFYTLFCGLQLQIARSTGETPIIHFVPLNDTAVLEQYKDLPLVGKCCPENEVLTKDESGLAVCTSHNSTLPPVFSPLFSDFNKTGVLVPGDEQEKFVALVGDPCKYGRYVLFPELNSEDEHYLLLNGSIFAPHHVSRNAPIMLQPGADYCMEIIPESGLRALACFSGEHKVATADSRITMYACGLLISVPFLVLTIAAYSITPKLRDVHGKALCHYCGCLAVAFTTLAITQLASAYLSDQFCVCIAFIIQFSFVACFFWLNVMCLETWALVKSHVDRETYTRMQPKRLFFVYSVWGWGPPALLILISMAMDLSPTIPATYVKPNFGTESCWFKSDDEAMPYFYIPVGLLFLGNLVLFIMTSVKLTKYQKDLAVRRLARNQESDRMDQRLIGRLRKTFLVCVVLFLLMGLNWIIELISWWAGGDSFEWSAFDLINALQGVLVFGLFVLRRPPRDYIWHQIKELRGLNMPQLEVERMNGLLLNGDMTPTTIIR